MKCDCYTDEYGRKKHSEKCTVLANQLSFDLTWDCGCKDIDQYAALMRKAAVYPRIGFWNLGSLIYPALKLASKVGEFCEHICRHYKSDVAIVVQKGAYESREVLQSRKEKMIEELGDIACYFVACCYEVDVQPSEVLKRSVEKLKASLRESI